MPIMTIPRPLQIALDDLGWFCAEDDRKNGGPSRTGVDRKHCYKDYTAVNELGKRLGMKINCGFVIGEWDPDNRLRSVKCLSKYGELWDNASYLDKEEMQMCADEINDSDYIDIAVHGLLHGYYTENIDNTDESDYYYHVNKKLVLTDEKEVRHRLDCFFDLLKYYKINKKINSFIPPSFTYRWNDISKILVDYGIDYVSTIYKKMECEGEKPTDVGIEDNGIITVDRNNNLIPWNIFDADFSKLPTDIAGVFGSHWPNFLHFDPDRNGEVVDRAVEYFEKCSQNFGTVLSKDMEFCAMQSLFCKFAVITEKDGVTTVDVSKVPKIPGKKFEFYISSKEPLETWIGCNAYDYEKKDGFATYRIEPISDVMKFDNV